VRRLAEADMNPYQKGPYRYAGKGLNHLVMRNGNMVALLLFSRNKKRGVSLPGKVSGTREVV
jgi:hypothetical protein